MTLIQSAAGWSHRPMGKLALIGALWLVMMVPALWVADVISEREARNGEAQSEIAGSWGPPQSILGPILVVPYRTLQPQPALPNGLPQPPVMVRSYAHVVPASLSAEVALSPERRKRGVFGAIVYGADIALAGAFTVPSLTIAGHPEAEFLWRESFVVAGATDLRSAESDAKLQWNGAALLPADDPPVGAECDRMSFLRWSLPQPPAPGQTLPFGTAWRLRGTQAFHLVPAARQVEMHVAAPWPTPSFNGAVLPARYDVTATGFEASWRDGGGARQAVWFGDAAMTCGGAAASVGSVSLQDGVDLLEAVPTYRMVNRAAKYSALFFALSFLTYFLFEMLSGARIHLVQYGLLGLSICLFPLLLLSIAEPLGFAVAYGISAAAVILQASLFTLAVTGRTRLACVFALDVAALFGLLYVVLQLESYALLAGSVALFGILSVVMAVTRRIDWSGTRAALVD